jgi:hypothetical protein
MRSIRGRDLCGSVVRIATRKKLALVIVLAAAALLPAASSGAGCRPLDCASSGTPLGHGLLAARPEGVSGAVHVIDLQSGAIKWSLPSGFLGGTTLVSKQGTTLTWYDALTGKQAATASITAPGSFGLVGASQNGARGVLQSYDKATKKTTFLIVSSAGAKTVVVDTLNWGFDALSGDRMYLLRYLRNGYQVRRYDLASGTLSAQPLKDPHESALIWGTPWARVASPDGRWLFTLYVGQNGGTMVHELDLRNSTARCVDLPGTGNFNAATSYAMELSHDGRTLWAASPGYGRVAAIDVVKAKVKVAFRFGRQASYTEAPTASVSALSPSGSQLAVSVGSELWLVSTAQRTVVKAKPHAVLALGFSTDGTKLWALTKGDAVVALPLA